MSCVCPRYTAPLRDRPRHKSTWCPGTPAPGAGLPPSPRNSRVSRERGCRAGQRQASAFTSARAARRLATGYAAKITGCCWRGSHVLCPSPNRASAHVRKPERHVEKAVLVEGRPEIPLLRSSPNWPQIKRLCSYRHNAAKKANQLKRDLVSAKYCCFN